MPETAQPPSQQDEKEAKNKQAEHRQNKAAAKEAEQLTRLALKATRIGSIPGIGRLAGKLVKEIVQEALEHKEVVIILVLFFTAPLWIFLLVFFAPVVLFIALAWAVRSTVSSSFNS